MPVINSASKSMDQGVWWAVDLEKQYEITAVTLHVFTSSTSGRSHSFNAILRLLDGNKTEVLRNPYRFADGESIIPLPVSPPVTAKHVQIQLKEENGTTLDIVEVFTSKIILLLAMLLRCHNVQVGIKFNVYGKNLIYIVVYISLAYRDSLFKGRLCL